ncbi:hypothetical protein PI124_g17764 [Phytophthora idaei]|nr:hypothetical protein PI126_g19621 [Phytophthora idaei]KAG3237244.1 hypothetical protein PI124_g17764 [Phytophthora idaei]
MLRIDKRKDQYGHLTYAQFNKRFPSTYKTSADGKCFLKALRIACHVVGGTDIVPIPLIEEFEDMLKKDTAKKGKELEEGVSLGVIKKFLTFLRLRRALLASNVISKNQLNRSITSFEGLCEFKLDPGVYVVGAACARQIKHCFVLRVYGDKRLRRVFDRWYEDGEDDDFYDEPLENLLWIRRRHFIFRFERVGKVDLSGKERDAQDELFLRSVRGKQMRSRFWQNSLACEDDEDPQDEVELLEICVRDTEIEICAAPDSVLLKRARIGYLKRLDVARKERAKLRRRNRQNMRNAAISAAMLERYKNEKSR